MRGVSGGRAWLAWGKGGEPAAPARLAVFCLAVMPALAACGPFASFWPGSAGAPYFYRIVIVVGAFAALPHLLQLRWFGAAPPRYLAYLAIAWVLWAPLTLLWTPAPSDGRREVVGATICLAGAVVAVLLANGARAGIVVLRWGYVAGFVVVALVSAWELATGKHLIRDVAHLPWNFRGDTIAATFYNPNNLSTFLLACVGPLVAVWLVARRLLVRISVYAGLGVLVGLIFMTHSRAGMLGVLLMAGVTLAWLFVVRPAVPKAHYLVLLPLAAAGVVTALAVSPVRAFAGQAFTSTFAVPDAPQADSLRVRLTLMGLKYFAQSFGLGKGAGAYETVLAADPHAHVIMLTNAHDTFVEIAAQYGVIVLVPLALVMWTLVRHAASAAWLPHRNDRDGIRLQLGLAVIALVVGALDASSVLAEPGWWLLVGYAVTLAWQVSREARGSRAPDRLSAGTRPAGSHRA